MPQYCFNMLYRTKNLHGGDIYEGNIELDFSANVNPFGTPDGVKSAIKACTETLSSYPDPYCRRLVSAIAEYEKVPKESILVGAGAAELIYSFNRAQKPRTAVELAPTFAEYSLSLEGADIKRFLLSEKDGFRLSGELIDFIDDTKPDTVFLCNPNNPTGLSASPELILAAADKCRSIGARLFLDECFMDLADTGESFVPHLAEYPNVIVLKAFTKSFGMAGVRLGYALSADAELLCAMSRSVQPWNVSTLAQQAGIAALKEKEFLENTRGHLINERPRFTTQLENCNLTVYESNVNFLLVKGAEDLDEKLLKKGIKIRNCANFSGLGAGFYRIAVKLREQNDRLIQAIKEVL